MSNIKLGDYQLLLCEDGYYLARPLKNGTISKDARKIEDKEIVTMFEEFLRRYCARNMTNILEVQRKGKVAFEAKLYIRD